MAPGFIRRLFGGGGSEAPTEAARDSYQGFELVATPQAEGDSWRVAGRIVRQGPEGEQVHEFVRADLLPSRDAAAEATLRKARRIVDEAGERLFAD